MRILVMISIILSLVIGCKMQKTDDGGKEQNIPKGDQNGLKANQTILETADNMDSVFGKNYKKWTPSNDDAESAEKLLNEWYSVMQRATVNYLSPNQMSDYNMQFMGAVDDKGKKIVWINCFAKAKESDFKGWKTKLVSAKGGGKNFFSLKVNITDNSYTDFKINPS